MRFYKLIIILFGFTGYLPLSVYAQGSFSESKQASYSGSVGISAMALGNSGEALIAWNPNAFEIRGLYRPDLNSSFSLLNIESSFGGPPTVLINDYGDMVVGWSGRNSGYVRVRFKPRGGSWEAAKTLDVSGDNNIIKSGRLGLAMNNKGDLLAAWKVQVGNEQQVRAVYRAAGSAWPNTFETVSTPATLASDAYDPLAAVDDAGNQALFWTKGYAEIGDAGNGTVFVLIESLRASGSGAWQPPVEKTARGPLSGNVPCSSLVTNMVTIYKPQISSDSKTGMVGIGYSYDPKAFEYQTGGEFIGKCGGTAASRTTSGFAASYGTVSAGLSATQMIYQGNDYYEGNFVGQIAVANSSSSAVLITQPITDNLDGIPSFHFGVGNPLPNSPPARLTGHYIGSRTSIGRDGTALGVVFDAGAGPADEPEDTRPPSAFLIKNGQAPQGPIELLPSGALANVTSNCRGDALLAIITDAPENKFYYIDYDSGNPNCIDGSVDPTPIPTPTATATKTPDASQPTATPTTQPTIDIFATAKFNSSNMYIALTNFYNAVRAFKHPKDPKGAKKLKNVKTAWKKLEEQFPQSTVPELMIITPWSQETFTKYYLAMKKAYRPVINAPWEMSDKQQKKYATNLRVLRGSPDFMRGILAYR